MAGNEGNNDPDPNDVCPSVSCSGSNLSSGISSGSASSIPIDSSSSQDDRYKNCLNNEKGAAKGVNGTQVPNYDGGSTVDCGLQGVMTSQAMPSKNTPALSLVQYFPWVFKDIDNSAPDPWSGSTINVQQRLYRGSGNNTFAATSAPTQATLQDQSNAATNSDDSAAYGGNATNSTTAVDTSDLNKQKCKPIDVKDGCSSAPDYDHIERLTRLQYDNCSNQYILGGALATASSSSSGSSSTAPLIMTQLNRDHGSPWNESWCQPLKMVKPACIPDLKNGGGCKKDGGSNDGNMYDYRAAAYLWEAWVSVLDGGTVQMPYYSPNGGVSGADAGTAPVKVGAAGTPDTPIKGPAVSGEDKLINLSTFIHTDPTQAGAYGYSNTNNCGTDTGGSCAGGAGASAMLSGSKITLKDISTYPYERIWDPTHPFSPRWDWKKTDRDYSVQAQLTGASGYDLSTSQCIVRCAAVPVDILSFRQPQFNACMSKRIQLNTQCFWTEVAYLETYIYPSCPPDTAAIAHTASDQTGCHPVISANDACKTYFARTEFWPPCSTKYDHPADVSTNDYCKDARDLIGDTAQASSGVKKCCDDLAMALTPLNTLKIRNTNISSNLTPVPEGYSFKDYFGNHMPYMRWWDTGAAAGAQKTDSRNYNPDCDTGQYDVLVGVGAEGSTCRFGGAGTAGKYPDDGSCINLKNPDALTSWTELKQYQSNTFRTYGLNCIGQYEKIYKPFSEGDGALMGVGGYFISAFPVKEVPAGTDPSGVQAQGYESKNNPWPLTWRGYLSDPDKNKRFPNFGSTSGGSTPGDFTGLSNAQVGDIIYLTFDDVDTPSGNPNNLTPDTNVMPFMAIVIGVGKDSCDNYVQVVDVNNGKFPDACGNTDYAGFGLGQSRHIYKNSVPSNVTSALYPTDTETGSCGTVTDSSTGGLQVNNKGNCKDPKMSVCTFGSTLWDKIHIYRPCKDNRGGSTPDVCSTTNPTPGSTTTAPTTPAAPTP